MNALLTQKRIIFLGHGQPAGHVANLVLAACALTGQVLRGFTERAFPYSNLAGLDMLEEVPGFIAGVTNPRFEELPSRWDVLCNMETGKVTVSKEIGKTETMSMHSSNQSMSSLAHSISGTKTEDDATSTSHGTSAAPNSAKDSRGDFKGETSDSIFMDDVSTGVDCRLLQSILMMSSSCTRSWPLLLLTLARLSFEQSLPTISTASFVWQHGTSKTPPDPLVSAFRRGQRLLVIWVAG
jgi:hypothetical protein